MRNLLIAPVTPLSETRAAGNNRGRVVRKRMKGKESAYTEVVVQTAPVALHHPRIRSTSLSLTLPSFCSSRSLSMRSYISLAFASSLTASLLPFHPHPPAFFPFQPSSQFNSAQLQLPITLQPLCIFDFVGY